MYTQAGCFGPGDCGSTYAQGFGASLMAQVLYGSSISVGAQAEAWLLA